MRSSISILAVSLVLVLVLGVSFGYAVIYGPTQGYAQYKVTVNVKSPQTNILLMNNVSFAVKETVNPGSQGGFVNLALELSSGLGNFSYTRDINATSLPEIFPFVPGVGNQSFSYQFQGISIGVSMANMGQISVTFNSTSYQATKYAIAITASNQTAPFHSSGTIIAMPSGLIYNAELTINETASVNMTLLSTSLSLSSPSSGINPLGVSVVGAAVAAAAVVVAAPVIFRARRKRGGSDESHESQDKVNPYDVD